MHAMLSQDDRDDDRLQRAVQRRRRALRFSVSADVVVRQFGAGIPWRAFVLGLACALSAAPMAQAAAERAAIFGFEFVDTSLEGSVNGPRADEQARLRLLDAQLRDALVASGRYEAVDIAPVRAQAQSRDLQSCDGCDVDLARQIGAQVAVRGWVQKVSNLILNINVEVRNVSDGRVLRAGSVDIRGNTDDTWTRGLAHLVKHRILPDAAPAAP
jgi:hypothetical protein